MENKFRINTENIHIANSKENISKTIEELLSLNNKIPARKEKDYEYTTEKQLEKEKYNNQKSRGEKEEITELQFKDRDNKEDDNEIIELSIEEAEKEMGGRRPEAWEPNEDKVRGHKDVPPIWLEVYRLEDDRKGK